MDRLSTMYLIRSSLLFLLVYAPQAPGQDVCRPRDPRPYLFFGLNTAYEVARNRAGIPAVPDCQPLQVWMLTRHGARWSSPSETFRFTNLPDLRDQVLSNHRLRRGSLCTEDLDRLRHWREFLVSGEEEDTLTPQGRRDARALGARVRRAFHTLLTNPHKHFVFRYTEMHRTKETAEQFAQGLFGEHTKPSFPDSEDDDRLLQAFEDCPAWERKNQRTEEKVDTFTRGELMRQVYHNVSRRLGFNYDLPYYVVEALYNSCSDEKAWSLRSHPAWCAAFTAPELQVLEYLEDLRFYSRTGHHGYQADMNKKLGCPLVKDMITRFMDLEKNSTSSQPAGVFYFSEAETLGLVAARLGLLEDRHHLPAYGHHSRRYRTSALVPFTGNILAVFYQCSAGEKHRVMFLVSEHVVDYPGCQDGLCPWSYIKHKFSRVVRSGGCGAQFCYHSARGWLPLPEVWAGIAVISTLLFVIHLIRAVNKLVE